MRSFFFFLLSRNIRGLPHTQNTTHTGVRRGLCCWSNWYLWVSYDGFPPVRCCKMPSLDRSPCSGSEGPTPERLWCCEQLEIFYHVLVWPLINSNKKNTPVEQIKKTRRSKDTANRPFFFFFLHAAEDVLARHSRRCTCEADHINDGSGLLKRQRAQYIDCPATGTPEWYAAGYTCASPAVTCPNVLQTRNRRNNINVSCIAFTCSSCTLRLCRGLLAPLNEAINYVICYLGPPGILLHAVTMCSVRKVCMDMF